MPSSAFGGGFGGAGRPESWSSPSSSVEELLDDPPPPQPARIAAVDHRHGQCVRTDPRYPRETANAPGGRARHFAASRRLDLRPTRPARSPGRPARRRSGRRRGRRSPSPGRGRAPSSARPPSPLPSGSGSSRPSSVRPAASRRKTRQRVPERTPFTYIWISVPKAWGSRVASMLTPFGTEANSTFWAGELSPADRQDDDRQQRRDGRDGDGAAEPEPQAPAPLRASLAWRIRRRSAPRSARRGRRAGAPPAPRSAPGRRAAGAPPRLRAHAARRGTRGSPRCARRSPRVRRGAGRRARRRPAKVASRDGRQPS